MLAKIDIAQAASLSAASSRPCVVFPDTGPSVLKDIAQGKTGKTTGRGALCT
jgi:hypothetical protein